MMGCDGRGEGQFRSGIGSGCSSPAILKTFDPGPLELPGPKALGNHSSCGQQNNLLLTHLALFHYTIKLGPPPQHQ